MQIIRQKLDIGPEITDIQDVMELLNRQNKSVANVFLSVTQRQLQMFVLRQYDEEQFDAFIKANTQLRR